jgi:hypothetical protein
MGSSGNNSRTGASLDVSRERFILLRPWKLAGVMHSFRSWRSFVAANALLAIALIGLALTPATVAGKKEAVTLHGTVESDGIGMADYTVSLYIAYVDHGPRWKFLGSDTSTHNGNFEITYSLPPGRADDPSILFVQAERGRVLLTSAISPSTMSPEAVVVNERTTVATGNAFAQFVEDRQIVGNTYGMLNAVSMAANFANSETGEVGVVLQFRPNGTETSTLATFNSLSNAVASCVANADNCTELFHAATPPGGPTPTNVLQAIANVTKNPAYPGYPLNAEDPVFQLSQLNPIYQPALTQRPTNWLLFLKITGGFYSAQDSSNLMNGPGNFAIDEFGFVWLNTNYQPRPPSEFACAGDRLIKFYPWGEPVPGTPFTGGGLSGAGYGAIRWTQRVASGSAISDSRIRPINLTLRSPRSRTASPCFDRMAPRSRAPMDTRRGTSRGRWGRCPTVEATSGLPTAATIRSRKYHVAIRHVPSTFRWVRHRPPAIHRSSHSGRSSTPRAICGPPTTAAIPSPSSHPTEC